MIPRTASSRRRRASRSAATSPHRGPAGQGGRRPSAAVVPGGPEASPGARQRRASIAVASERDLTESSPVGLPDRDDMVEFVTVTAADDPESESEAAPLYGNRSPVERSPRGSLTPDAFNRSPRNSLVPCEYNRSPRGSLVPQDARGSRNNLLPEHYSRSPRGSLVPGSEGAEFARSSRLSLLPDAECFNRSPRGSLVPDYSRSPRGSLVPETNHNRSPRGSLVPENNHNRSPRNSLVIETNHNRSPRSSLVPENNQNRSPRGSLVPDTNPNRSHRNSLVCEPGPHNRSPRGSIASEASYSRSPRNSLPLQDSTPTGRSPRGSLGSAGYDAVRSPRGSIDIQQGRSGCNRSPSPYRWSRGSAGPVGLDSLGSRRPSSSLGPLDGVKAILIGPAFVSSQLALARTESLKQHPPGVSGGDERRQLCGGGGGDHGGGGGGGGSKLLCAEGASMSATAYGSVVYQLNHANIESSSLCDFLSRAVGIVYRTVVVTVVLVCLTALPIIMFIIGLQFVRDCPKEPHIPVYMIVGGSLGTLKMVWVVWRQVSSRRYERLEAGRSDPSREGTLSAAGSRIADVLLTAFLVVWFVLGNLWILGIYWPDFEPTLFEPDRWCHKTLYVFALVHLVILYSVLAALLTFAVGLITCQICLCPILISCK